jgi:hypothetical protein
MRNSIPAESYLHPLILIKPQMTLPEGLDQWAWWIKREVYMHYVWNLLAVCMSLCLTASLEERRTSDAFTGSLAFTSQLTEETL